MRRRRFLTCFTTILAAGLLVAASFGYPRTTAAADQQANARTVARVMQVQDRNTARLMANHGVVGTATGLNAKGQPVVKVFVAEAGVRGIPDNVEGVPVAITVTGPFATLAPPAAPPGRTMKNSAPAVEILSPADGSMFDTGDAISFVGAAFDNEDGDVTANLAWYSSLVESDGWIGAGESFSDSLPDGIHTITAEVTDSGGKTGSASITIAVGSVPEQPVDRTGWFPRPVPIGVSTGHPSITAGTIGCRVHDSQGNVFVLSNNHVYANCNRAEVGDHVLQPGAYDGGLNPLDAIGTLFAFMPIVFGPKGQNTVDAAIALSSVGEIGRETPSDGYGLPKSQTLALTSGDIGSLNVQKYGRTTGWTFGLVSDINATVRVSYSGAGWALFVNQIVVTPGTFSAGGDSGSLVVVAGGDNDRRPVGLLFAGSSSHTLCNPIGEVLDQLQVTIDGQ